MSKLKGKLTRRIMAIVLSGAMVMSNMSAYAAELAPETEVVSEVEETAAAETTADTAGEEAVSDAKEDNAETEASVAMSSESKAEEATVKNAETEDADKTETDTETVESTVAEKETESAKDKETEAEEKESSVKDEDVKEDLTSDCGTYTTSTDDDGYAVKTWDFTSGMPTTAKTLNDKDTINGLLGVVKNSKSTLKLHNGGYLNYKPGDYVAVPITSDTESVKLYMYLTGNNTDRYFKIGNGTNYITVYHNNDSQKYADGTDVIKENYFSKDSNEKVVWTGEISSDYFATDDDGKLWLYLEAGTLQIKSTTDSGEMKIGTIQITEIKPEEKPVNTGLIRTDWTNDVSDPEIKEATYTKGEDSITVTVKGAVNTFDADELTLYMYDTASPSADTEPIDEQKAAKATNKHTYTKTTKNDNDEDVTTTYTYYYTTVKDSEGNEVTVSDDNFDVEAMKGYTYYTDFTFKPETSGKYYFQAVLSRDDEKGEDGSTTATYDDKNSGETLTEVDFKIPLTKPAAPSAKYTETDDDGKGVVTVKWDAVDDADYYVIAAEYTDEANKDKTIEDVKYTPAAPAEGEESAKSFEKTLTVNMDSEIKVTVQAFRNTYSSEEGSTNTEKFDYSEISEAKDVTVAEPDKTVKAGAHILDIEKEFAGTANSTKFSSGALTALGENDTAEKTYTSADGYFKLHYNGNTRIDAINKTFNGETKTLAINMQGNLADAEHLEEGKTFGESSFEFTVNEVPAAMTVYWYGAGNGTRDIHVLDSEGKAVEGLYDSTDGSSTMMVSEFTITTAGKYYLGCKTGGCRICYVKVSEPAKLDIEKEFAGTANSTKFSSGALTALGENDTAEKTYTSADGYFKLHYNGNTRIDSINKTFNGETKTLAINMQGNLADAEHLEEGKTFGESSFEFTVNEVPAAMTVYWYGAGNGTRDIHVLDSEGKAVEGLYDSTDGSSTMMVSEFTITTAGKYYLGCKTGGCRICYIEVKEGYTPSGETADRGNWETDVAAPEITNVEVADGKIKVTAKGVVDLKGVGADSITVEMYNADLVDLLGDVVKPVKTAEPSTANTKADADGNHLTTFELIPSSTGNYTFKAVLSREDEKDESGNITAHYEDKTSSFSKPACSYNLPLNTPAISTLMNLDKDEETGTGGISVAWGAVNEADYYIVYVKDASGSVIARSANTEGTSAEVTKLTIGDTVNVTVIAYRENTSGDPDASAESASKEIKITGEAPNVYIMDAADETRLVNEETGNLLSALNAGTKLGTEDYFTVAIDSSLGGSALPKSAGTGKYIEINKYGSTGLTFTVYGTADATFNVASTGGSNESAFGLVNSKGELVAGSISGTSAKSEASQIYEAQKDDSETKGTAYIAYGTDISTIEYKELPAGTYTFLSPYTSRNRGGRVHRAVVYDNGSMPYRGDWSDDDSKIGTPVISKVEYVKGNPTITVIASGYIGYYGADSLKVEMLDSNGEIVETNIKASDSKTETKTDEEGKEVIVSAGDVDLEYTFTPTASDDYSFKASLVRNGEEDIVMKDSPANWTVDKFVLPLATPSVSSMTNLEYSTDKDAKGSLEVTFKGVDEADYYVIAAFSENGKELLAKEYFDIEKYPSTEEETAENEEKKLKLASAKDEDKGVVTLEGLDKGSCYVTVQAFRNADSSLNLKAETTTIARNAETGAIEKNVDDTLALAVADLKKAEENAGLSDEELQAKALESLKTAVSPTEDDNKFAVAVLRSKAFSPDASKYVNGKNDTRWSHTVYGSNTTRSPYSRPKELNALDGEYDSSKSVSIPANGYYEEVFTEDDPETKGDNKTKDPGDLKSVTVWSENGRGKVVPASIDGMSYYYTAVNPEENNFSLSALIHVKSWKYSNGQDGFGMMVSDVAGPDGDDRSIWTNAYQLLASKIQYSWVRAGYTEDGEGYVTSAGGNGTSIMRYEMKLGVGWNSKEGATAADVAKINSGVLTVPEKFLTDSGTLETAAGNNDLYTGSYNIVGNCFNTKDAPDDADNNLLTDFRFQIEKYDNAYVLRYLAVDATASENVTDQNREDYQEISGKYYEILGEQAFSDDNNNKLTLIDKNNVYVGFFAARNARIGISEIDLDLKERGEEYIVPPTIVDPSVTISSMEASNSENYDLVMNANFDGTLTVYKVELDEFDDEKGPRTTVTAGKAITAGTKYTFTTKLNDGRTKFIYYAQPNLSYVPGDNQILSNFDMKTNEYDEKPFTVTYHAFDGDTIYVEPWGAYVGDYWEDDLGVRHYAGSKEHPTNVYDAVNYAKAGDTIILAGGTYDLTTDAYSDENGAANLLVGKKHDGTANSYITMKAADKNNRPVLDFGQNTQKNDTAFTIAGNYWHFEGFDVMGSRDGQKGILLAGSHNILSDIRTYFNGNTGVQVARYGNDGRAEWPSYNTLINCSSFMNYDAGYEDADGYAAKLTCGDGNKFIGCIAAYNADDGWDLFAKKETGSIGIVTLESCLAFKNGYLFGIKGYYDGSDLVYRYTDFSKYTKNTPVLSAGNGNGFKMGGDSLSGYHVLKNSIAFGNKSKGIDSNSCPDIQIENCISFNNEVNNVAIYTGDAVNTDYSVKNVISFKDSSCSGYGTAENFGLRGTQNPNKVFGIDNYFWNGSKSVNSKNGKAYDGDTFDTSVFMHTSMSTAIFGNNKICRDWNNGGSINLNGFLVKKDGSSVIESTDPTYALDKGYNIYVFAAENCQGSSKLADISLADYNKYIKELTGYDKLSDEEKANYKDYGWVDDTIATATYAGSAVNFMVTNGTYEKTVTVNFIQLDGAELRLISGDNNDNGVLDKFEKWTVEAVPVISPAVEPDKALSSDAFKAEIKETSKGLLKQFTATAGEVNKNLNVAGARAVLEENGFNGDVKLTAEVSLTVGSKTVKQTTAMAFRVSNGRGIKFSSTNPANGKTVISNPDRDDIRVDMKEVTEFTLENLHFYETVEDKDSALGYIVRDIDFGKGVTIKVNDTSVIKLDSTTATGVTGGDGVDAKFTVVNKSGDGGTATVTVTSKDDKSLVRNYVVTVSGSDFAWNAGTVEIDKAKTAGIQLTALAPFDLSMTDVKTDKTVTNEDGSNKTENKKANEIITVKEVYKGAKVSGSTVDYNDYFEAKLVTGDVYELNTTAAAADLTSGLPKGVYTVIYQAEARVTTTTKDPESGKETFTVDVVKRDFTPITIKVTETKPTVTFKQTKKVNLFYNNTTTGSNGKLSLISKQGSVTLVAPKKDGKDEPILSVGGKDTAYYRFSYNGEGYDIVSIRTEDGKTPVKWENEKAVYKDATGSSAKAELRAHVDGYYDAYDVIKPFTVGVEYRQPKLKLTTLDKTIYTKIGMKSANIWIYNPDTDTYLTPDTAAITLETESTTKAQKKAFSKANEDFTVNGTSTVCVDEQTGVNLKITDDKVKGGAIKLSITHDDWFSKDPVIVSESISVTDKVPKMTIKPAKLNMNTDKFVGQEQAASAILLNGAEGFTINDIQLKGANAKADDFMEFVDCKVAQKDGKNVLLVSLKAEDDKGNPFPASYVEKNGKRVYKMNQGWANSYSFTASYKLGSATEPQTTTFKISLVNNEKLTISTKGSINLIDRENGTVTLKPKMTNFTPSQVSDVTLEGDAASLFTLTGLDRSTGEITVKAKDTADLKQGSYMVTPVYTFDLGVSGTATMKTEKPIKITTKQPALKISGLKTALEVKLSDINTPAQRTIIVTPADAYITGMTQINGLDNFTLTYTGDGVQVAIKNKAGLKEGTTYKITAIVTVEGSGSNVKKQIITVPVRVIR